MNVSKVLAAVVLVAVTAMTAFAADEAPKKKKKDAPAKEAKQPAAVTNVLNKVETLDLTSEQKEKIKAIAEDFAPKFAEQQKKLNEVLTDEQKKARAEAQKAARAEGKKGKELQEAVQAALKLSDEQKKTQTEVQEAQKKLNAEFVSSVKAVLNDEQREKAQLGGGKRAKKAA